MNEPFEQFTRHVSSSSTRVVRTWQGVSRQPSWVRKAALITFLIVFVLPIVVLGLLAAVIAAAVFLIFAGVYMAVEKTKRALRGDGRKNVRVIQRRE